MVFDVAYGVPERSVSEAQLRAALAVVAENFDEAPTRMHAVLGPPGQGIRWFSFACTVFARGRVLAQDHFSDVMETELAELIVVVRKPGDEPAYCEVRGTRGAHRSFLRQGETIYVERGFPPDARRDGELDEIALAALGLPIVRPFVVLAKPTHEVVLRGKHVGKTFPIVPFSGADLSVRVHPRLGGVGDGERFARTPRTVDAGDRRSLRTHVDRIMARAEDECRWHPVFDDKLHAYAREVVRAGHAVAPVLVELLAQPKPRPQTSQLALTALGLLGMAADAIVPWLARSSETLRLAAFCALARQGELARPALVAAGTSRKSAERVAGQALLAILDAKDFAPIRATRAARDALDDKARAKIAASFTKGYELPQTLVFNNTARFAWYLRDALEAEESGTTIGHALHHAPDDSMWAVALLLIETPVRPITGFQNYTARDRIVEAAANRYGAAFGPVADVLLRFPPLADDPIVGALARGKPVPTWQQLTAVRAKRVAKKPTAKPRAAKQLTVKKSTAKKPAARR